MPYTTNRVPRLRVVVPEFESECQTDGVRRRFDRHLECRWRKVWRRSDVIQRDRSFEWGTQIGTFTGGASGTNLVITLDSNADATAVTALVKNITYTNTDTDAPTTGARTVRFVLTDGDGGTSANYDTTVTVSGQNDAPTITNLAGDNLVYTEGDGAQVIDQSTAAIVTDSDSSDFNTGTLTVSFTAGSDSAEDVLAIRDQGAGHSGNNRTPV